MSGSLLDVRAPLANGYGPDIGAAVAQGLKNASDLAQLQQVQQQVKRANQLRGILGAPDAIDPATGMAKPETIGKVMGVDPAAGIKLGENAVMTQQRLLQMQGLRGKASLEQTQMLNDTFSPIVLQYEEAVKSGKVTPAQANADAQVAWSKAREELVKGGGVPPDMAQNIPTQWNYQDAKRRALASDVYQTNLKRQDAEQSELRKEKHDELVEGRTGTTTGTLADGTPVVFKPNAPPGQRVTYAQSGKPVPEELLQGARKMGAAPTSAAALDDQRIERSATFKFEQGLGHAATTPEEKAKLADAIEAAKAKQKDAMRAPSAARADQQAIRERARYDYEQNVLGHPVDPNSPEEMDGLNKAYLDAEQKAAADKAAGVTTSREGAKQAATKPSNLMVTDENGRARSVQGIWDAKGQQWVEATPEHAPIKGSVVQVGRTANAAAEAATPEQIDLDARIWLKTGQDVGGFGSMAYKQQVHKRGAEIAAEQGLAPEDIIEGRAGLKSDQGALTSVTRQASLARSFERAANSELDLLVKSIPKTAEPLNNQLLTRWVRTGERQFGDTPTAQYHAVLVSALDEYAKVLMGATGAQGSTDSARAQAASLIPEGATTAQIKGIVDVMRQGMKYKIDSYDKTIGDLRGGIARDVKKPAAETSAPSGPQVGAKATEEQARSLPRPKTPDEAEKLGAGNFFITPTGIIGQVPGQSSAAPPPAAKPAPAAPPAPAQAAPKQEAESYPVPEQFKNKPDGTTFNKGALIKRGDRLVPNVAGGDDLARAKEAIAKGAPREKVIQRLKEAGIDTKGL